MFFIKTFPRIAIVLVAFLALNKLKAQDLAMTPPTASPNSGCMLSSTETVQVTIFNAGPDLFVPFDISYTVDGGPPVTETYPLPTFLSSSTYTITFPTADLSAFGTYNICYYTTLVGETNYSNDTICETIINDTLTDPGVLSDTLVCSGANIGTLDLVGSYGGILGWEISNNLGGIWFPLPLNTTTSQAYSNLVNETWYRVRVKNGFCPEDTSNIAMITLDPPPIGGTLTGPDTVCEPPNSGTISLAGEFGTIDHWEISYDGGSIWTTTPGTTQSIIVPNILGPGTAMFRALIYNGVCSATPSGTHTVIVKPGATGGTLSSLSGNVCIGQNSEALQLSGYSGVIDHWESSTTSGVIWNNVPNITDSDTTSNIVVDTWYRVVVLGCLDDTSSTLILTVDPLSVAGTLTLDTTVCEGLNNGVLTVSGETGVVDDWIDSTGSTNWQSTGQTGTTYSFTNLINVTQFQVVVKNGACPADTSNSVLVGLFPYNYGVSNDTSIIDGGSANLSAYGGASYVWSPGVGLDDSLLQAPLATPLQTTTYVVDITDTNSCIYYDSILVTVGPEPLEISNLITANGDGFNDYWIIKGIQKISDVNVKIFNKKGVVVYVSDDYQNDWDGNYQGNFLPSGTYYYIVEHPDLGLFKSHLNILTND